MGRVRSPSSPARRRRFIPTPAAVDRGAVRVETVRTLAGLEAHADAWNRLARDSHQPLPMLTHAWVASYFEHRLRPDQAWCCWLVYEGACLLGVLPLVVRTTRVLGLEALTLRTPHDWDTMTVSVDFLLASGREREVMSRILGAVDQTCPGWIRLSFRYVPATSPVVSKLSELPMGGRVWTEFAATGGFLRTAGRFEDYRRDLSSKFKRTLKNTNNRVARLSGVETLILTGADATDHRLESFLKLEGSGWKGRSGTAISDTGSVKAFYQALVDRLARLGWLEWHFVEAAGRPMVGQLAAHVGRSLAAIKIGYNEGDARYSPGTYLYERVIRRAFESSEVDEINFISDAAWLRKWRVELRPHYNVDIIPRGFAAWVLVWLPKTLMGVLRRIQGLSALVRRLRAWRAGRADVGGA